MPSQSTRPPPIPAGATRTSPPPPPARARQVPPPPPRAKVGPPPLPSGAARSTPAQRGQEASALVDAARRGDPSAFGELVRRYRPRIYALALHMTGSESDADDIAQDAFLRAFRKLPEFEGRSEFFTWVYRIALHRALNTKRDRKRRPLVEMEDPRVAKAVVADSWGDPRRAAELRETYSRLLAAFDRLSPLLRTTLVLVVLQGLSHAEAAVVLGSTCGTIAWRVHEARNQLRRWLDDDTLFDRDPSGEYLVTRVARARKEHSGPHPALAPPFSLERALALLIA